MIRNLKGKKKGFSLVELIVVIAIMGILAAVAVPKFSAYQKNAEKRAMENAAKLMADATLTAVEAGEITLSTSSELDSAALKKVKAYLNKDLTAAGNTWHIIKIAATQPTTSNGVTTPGTNAKIRVELKDSGNTLLAEYNLDI